MTTPDVARKPASLGRTVKAVAWGFFGVRKNADYQQDIAKLSPLHVIAVGLVGVMLFVGVLIVLVKYAVAG